MHYLLLLLYLAVVIYAIIRVAKSSAGNIAQTLWILAIIGIPLLGVAIWALVGPRDRSQSPSES